MLDLLAAISSVDPPALLAWLVFLFAASGYPLGIMLGSSCSPCCGTPCTQCTEGELPDTVTVAISGYVDGQVQGPDLAQLSFSSDYGSGAAGKVTSPSGDPEADKGPITAISVTNGGDGYARIARVQPTVTASASGGSGASFGVTLDQIEHEGRPAWEVASVSLTSGGTGYPDYASLTFNVATGDTENTAASAQFFCGRVAPTVTVAVSGTGTGAVLSGTLSSATGWDGKTYWYVSAISITNAGAGYSESDSVNHTVTDGTQGEYSSFYALVSVDEDGAVTGVTLYDGGEFFKSNGIIQSVELDYYGGGGIYYRDDPSLPGEEATVTVSVNQLGPTAGIAAGAVLAAVIDGSPSSATFGQITSVTITDGGDDYLAWAYRNVKCCEDYWNGMTVVLKRQESNPCVYSHGVCGTTCGAGISVEYRGPSQYPLVTVSTNQGGSNTCAAGLTGTSYVSDCSAFSFTATNENGITASVTSGGSYDATDKADNGTGRCFSCCRAEDDPPEEIEVEIHEKRWISDPLGGINAVVSDWISPAAILLDSLGRPTGTTDDTSGILVLRKGLQYVNLPFSDWVDFCDLPWGGRIAGLDSFGNSYVGYSVTLVVKKCSDPLGEDCDHCWKKCETRAIVQTIYNCAGTSNAERGISEGCENCDDSPMCGPVAGEYFVISHYTGSGLCEIPGGVRVTVL
jgi:hypothetical protein